jgi:geranylgeranyl diphosphate synthase type II
MTTLFSRIQAEVERQLSLVVQDFSEHPEADEFVREIVRAHSHPLCVGGKRVRPMVVLLAAGAIGGERALRWGFSAGTSLECVHTYSLVHDDLPCMDNDDFRRGNPTTHRLFGEAKGLLVGDGLLTRAFEILSDVPACVTSIERGRAAEWASLATFVLSSAAGFRGMVFGQWIDMSKFGESQRDSETLWKTIAFKKTGCLLGAAFELGVLSGLAHVLNSEKTLYSKEVEKLRSLARECGGHLGVAFQIVDDVLDVTASSDQMGKTTGKDLQQDKLTAVQLWGLDQARQEAAVETQRAQVLLRELWDGVRLLGGGTFYPEYADVLEDLVRRLLVREC